MGIADRLARFGADRIAGPDNPDQLQDIVDQLGAAADQLAPYRRRRPAPEASPA